LFKFSRSADGPEDEREIFPALPTLAQNVVEIFGSGTWLASVGGLNDPINLVEVRGTNALTNNQSGNGAPSNSPEDSSDEPKDFDDSANALWSLYEQEAKYRDEAQIQTLKDDMDGVLIQVCICIYYLPIPIRGQPN